MRMAMNTRETKETFVSIELNLDGSGVCDIDTGIGFFNHMLNLLCSYALFDVKIDAQGDLCVDCHHTVEDIGIVFGRVFKEALSDKKGIARYGSFYMPMDEALCLVVVDISGRPMLVYNKPSTNNSIGDFSTEVIGEFLRAFCINSGITLHINVLYGNNTHHIFEAIFKGLGKALQLAISDTNNQILSTKGIID